MHNRKATLEVYFVHEPNEGRKEATWMMEKDGTLVRQNIILSLWDNQRSETVLYSERSTTFYRINFSDSLALDERVQEIAKRFNGTHSRMTRGYQDNASFGILQKKELMEYLESLVKKD